MFCIKELKLLYAAVVLLLEAELLVNIEAMESRSSSLLTQNPDDLKSLELCTNRNQQRLGSVYGNFTRHHKKGHRRRTTSTTPATSIYTTTDVNDVTEVYSTTEVRIEEHPKLPKPLRLTARLEDYDVNIDSILDDELRELMPRHPNSRRIDNKEFIQELSDVSLAKSLSKIKKIHRDTSSSLSNKLSGKSNKNGIFLTENCTTVVAQIGTTAILHCEVSDITENTVTWIRRKDYSLLSVGLVTYSADSRFFSAHGRHVKGAWNLNFRHRYSAGWGLLTSKTINAIIQSQWLKTSEDWALHIRFATSADAGYYECQVPTHPPTSIFFKLVLVAAYAEIIGESEKIIHEGSMLRLVCVVRRSTEPPSYVFWYFENRMINYDLNGVSVHNGRQTSELVIGRAEPRHAGNYTCVPANARAASVTVHVVQSETPAAMQHGNNSSGSERKFDFICIVLMSIIMFSLAAKFV